MPKSSEQLDVLILGDHPATYLAAAILHQKHNLRVLHATIPGQSFCDRLTIINPDLFALHPLLGDFAGKLKLSPIVGLQFLSGDPLVRCEHRTAGAIVHVVSCSNVRGAMQKLANENGVECITPKTLEILHLDEKGIDVSLGKNQIRATMILLGGELPQDQLKLLGLHDAWEPQVLHRYTFLKLKCGKWLDASQRNIARMSLDLGGTMFWAWLLPHGEEMQIAVVQPIESVKSSPPTKLMQIWIDALQKHKTLRDGALPMESMQSIDLPLAGALAHEGVANRTLLIGPAGGFFSACADIYPNCWSALFATDAIKKALKEEHLQDGLQSYRAKWRTTLGDYLRGPQQNLRFLLPLVYRNPTMSARLAESILLSKSVVR